jgi:hypothetical protein
MTFPGTRWEEVKEVEEIDEDDEIVGNGLCVLLKLGGGSIWILWIERERGENEKVSCILCERLRAMESITSAFSSDVW